MLIFFVNCKSYVIWKVIKMTRLISLAMLLISTQVCAEWVQIGQGDSPQGSFTYYYDPSTSINDGENINVEILADFNSPINYQNGKSYKSVRETIGNNCRAIKQQRKSFSVYSDSMGNGAQLLQNAVKDAPLPVLSNSPAEILFKTICGGSGIANSTSISSSIGPMSNDYKRFSVSSQLNDFVYSQANQQMIQRYGGLFSNCRNVEQDYQIFRQKFNELDNPRAKNFCSQILPQGGLRADSITVHQCASLVLSVHNEVWSRGNFANNVCKNKNTSDEVDRKNRIAKEQEANFIADIRNECSKGADACFYKAEKIMKEPCVKDCSGGKAVEAYCVYTIAASKGSRDAKRKLIETFTPRSYWEMHDCGWLYK